MAAVASGYMPGFATSKSVINAEELFTRPQPPAVALSGLVTTNAMKLARHFLGRPEAQVRYNALATWAKEYREQLGPCRAMCTLPDEFCLVVEEVRFDVFYVDFFNPPRWRGRSAVKWDTGSSTWKPSGSIVNELSKVCMG